MKHEESNIQIAGMEWLRLQYPKVALNTFHIGNERKTSAYAGLIMQKMGVLAGVSDLFLAWPIAQYHGMFLEIKSKKGRLSPLQSAFLERMTDAGYHTEVCYDVDQIINAITWYLSR